MKFIQRFNKSKEEISIMQLHSIVTNQEWFKIKNLSLVLENTRLTMTNGTKEHTIFYLQTYDLIYINFGI